MTGDTWDDYLGSPDDAPADEQGGGLPADAGDDASTDFVALAETELGDASTDIIHASTTDDVDTMHAWTTDGSEE